MDDQKLYDFGVLVEQNKVQLGSSYARIVPVSNHVATDAALGTPGLYWRDFVTQTSGFITDPVEIKEILDTRKEFFEAQLAEAGKEFNQLTGVEYIEDMDGSLYNKKEQVGQDIFDLYSCIGHVLEMQQALTKHGIL